MARNDRPDRKTPQDSVADPGDARRPHSIRFSDSEWQRIEDAALRHGVSAGEIVRAGALAAAERRLDAPLPAALSPGHLALIEESFRMIFVMATLRREELRSAGRADEVEDVVTAAHEAMAETMSEGPAQAVSGASS